MSSIGQALYCMLVAGHSRLFAGPSHDVFVAPSPARLRPLLALFVCQNNTHPGASNNFFKTEAAAPSCCVQEKPCDH